ncbi:MAG: macro domain-containing protein [Candidatus Electryonea clarkiae]|nr:macro domain-containing protein [Candidatus Electryonea clarkiae]MDP8285463.1 macro domain-containing protein [Candidatus Electryonea clarkiae]
MPLSKKINNSTLSLIKGDLTDLDIEAFVFYAESHLKLGAGFGNAITMRGGVEIKKELDTHEPIEVSEAIITGAGLLKANYIIHANGPKYSEENTESKYEATLKNSLKCAEEKGIKKIAYPPMGTGFYAIPPPYCAQTMVKIFSDYLEGETTIEEITICAMDTREYEPFKPHFTD